MHTQKRSPAVGDRAPRNAVQLDGQDRTENSLPLPLLQALTLSRRFGLTVPVAKLVAELHYGLDPSWEHISSPTARALKAIPSNRQWGRTSFAKLEVAAHYRMADETRDGLRLRPRREGPPATRRGPSETALTEPDGTKCPPQKTGLPEPTDTAGSAAW